MPKRKKSCRCNCDRLQLMKEMGMGAPVRQKAVLLLPFMGFTYVFWQEKSAGVDTDR